MWMLRAQPVERAKQARRTDLAPSLRGPDAPPFGGTTDAPQLVDAIDVDDALGARVAQPIWEEVSTPAQDGARLGQRREYVVEPRRATVARCR
jgi:hypothetical protein